MHLSVKVEQEMRSVPERDRRWKIDRWMLVVDEMATSEEGRRELAAICAAYLREHRPQTSVTEVDAAVDERAARAPLQAGAGGGRGGRPGRSRGGRRRRRS